MKYRAVFFDLDGTLMDTSDGIFSGGRYAMDKVGIPMEKSEFHCRGEFKKAHKGHPDADDLAAAAAWAKALA